MKIQLPQDKGEFWIKNGICYCDLKGDYSIVDAKRFYQKLAEYTEGPIPILGLNRKLHSISREARVFYANESASFACAVAILTQSPVSKVIGNFFVGLNKPSIPTRLFTLEQDALNWLLEFKNGK